MKKYLVSILLLIIIVSITTSIYAENDYYNVKAKVVQIDRIEEIKNNTNQNMKIQKITLRILEGEYKDEECKTNYILQTNTENKNIKQQLEEGTKVLINIEEKDGEINNVEIKEVVRQNYLFYMLIAILLLLIFLEREKSIKIIITIVLNVLLLYLIFIIPISNGINILIATILVSILIAIINAVLQNGLNKNSYIAIICSCIISTCICYILSRVIICGMKLSGQIFNISMDNILVDIKELIYAGIIITSMGINVSIASYIVTSQKNVNSEIIEKDYKKICKKCIDCGIEFCSKNIVIPILLYLCGAASLIAIFTENINNELTSLTLVYMGINIIGSFCTIYLTSSLYALINKDKIIYKTKSDNIIEGKRSLKL